MLTIISNGSKWAGEQPDSIDQLMEVLSEQPLDKTFELYGNFYDETPEWKTNPQTGVRAYSEHPNVVNFFGNFYAFSHVFNIVTDDQEVIEKLLPAIRANQRRSDYLSQPAPATPQQTAQKILDSVQRR